MLIETVVPFCYFATVGCILIVKLLAPLNRLLLYGKNAPLSTTPSNTPVDHIASWTVPKYWFGHFYAWLIAGSSAQLLYFRNSVPGPAMDKQFYGAKLIVGCMLIQGCRRLYESIYVSKQSRTARINIVHYLIGMGHYSLLMANSFQGLLATSRSGPLRPQRFLLEASHMCSSLDRIQWILLVWFAVASYRQNRVHSYLASLKKYSAPTAFRTVLCPHYWNEIQIYQAFAGLACDSSGPTDPFAIGSLACLAFVVTNLAVTSRDTRRYYAEKYHGAVPAPHSVIPGIL